jgi:glycosyltransferase involved in cell wall biosynthesis
MNDSTRPGVAIVSERSPADRGGLAVSTLRIAQQAVARGEEVHVLCWSKEAPPGARRPRQRDGMTIHHVGKLDRGDDALMALTHHTADVVVERRLSLVHGLYALAAGHAATVAAAWCGTASLVSIRGNDLDRGLFRASDLPLLQSALTRATLVTAVTQEARHRASASFARNVRYIPNSVDIGAFRPETTDNSLVASLGLADGAVIGFSGELREKKGMRYLLPAFARLAQHRSVRLLLIGGVRSDARAAWDAFLAAAPEVIDRIHVLDYQRSPKRLSNVLSVCDLLVFPSLYEGMPNAVMEAMAVERLVLATQVGGHVDLIEHGTSGALLPLSELDQLPDAMEELLDLPTEQRRSLGTAARRRMAESFDPQQESDGYARGYADARALHAASAQCDESN